MPTSFSASRSWKPVKSEIRVAPMASWSAWGRDEMSLELAVGVIWAPFDQLTPDGLDACPTYFGGTDTRAGASGDPRPVQTASTAPHQGRMMSCACQRK